MVETVLQYKNNDNIKEYIPMVVSAIIVTLLLLYIDEGYYNFSWMSNIGNWIVGTVYVVIISVIQIAVYKLVLFPLKGTMRTGLSIGLGIFVAFATLFFMIY